VEADARRSDLYGVHNDFRRRSKGLVDQVSDEQKNQDPADDTEGHLHSADDRVATPYTAKSDKQFSATPVASAEKQSGDEDDTEGNSMSPTTEWAEGVATKSEQEWTEQQHAADEN
jgi:hypothetical protein